MPTVSADGRIHVHDPPRLPLLASHQPTANRRDIPLQHREGSLRRLGKFTPGPYLVDDIRREGVRSGKASRLWTSYQWLPSRDHAHPSIANVPQTAGPQCFCPVPTGTPFVPGAPLRGSGLGDGYIPSAGPYYVADYKNDKYVILNRNPNYHGPRPHRLMPSPYARASMLVTQSITFSTGVGTESCRQATTGQLRSTRCSLQPVPSPRSTTRAPSMAIIRQVPLPGNGVLALNARRAPFADPAIRKAAALAIDSKPSLPHGARFPRRNGSRRCFPEPTVKSRPR